MSMNYENSSPLLNGHGGQITPVADGFSAEHAVQLRDAMIAAGIEQPPTVFVADDRWHRFAPTPGRSQSATYRIALDPVAPVAWFQDWRIGCKSVFWKGTPGRTPSPQEIEDWNERISNRKRRAEKERREGHAIESVNAQVRLDAATPAPADHEYLRKKHIKPHGLKVENGCLVVPLRDIEGKLWSLLRIFPDGFKMNQEHARAAECFYTFGDIDSRNGNGDHVICLAEGFATAATIFEATGMPTVSACDAGNLVKVARLLRKKYPAAEIIVCGDDDWFTRINGKDRNTGKIAATSAAREVGGILAMPDFGQFRSSRKRDDTDFNDQFLRFRGVGNEGRDVGLANVRQTLADARRTHRDRQGDDDDRGSEPPPEPSGAIVIAGDIEAPSIAPEEDPSHDAGHTDDESRHRAGFSDDALALRFVDEHVDDLRYVDLSGKWLVWDGARWRRDDKKQFLTRSREMLRAVADETADAKIKKAVRANKTISAVVTLAKADQRIALVVDDLDRDPWLLNTPGGTVNLLTGERRDHWRSDHITRMTAATPGGECPRWRTFLKKITNDDADLEAFIQRMLGYALTGSTQEQCLFFLYGGGANGKSVLLSTVASVLGDYHTTAPIETFTEQDGSRHPTEIAGLQGARLVTSNETEEGRRWAETKVKQLTGGDRVKARFMRQDFFEFTPQFKLVIAGNHKPALRTVDEAIRRRFRLVPFSVTIPPEQRDKQLGEKLKEESGGILQWIIDGCVSWQRNGLQPPKAVLDATKEYLESEDAMGAWIRECCEIDPNAYTTSSRLFASWSEWANKAGEYVGSMKKFSQKLEGRPGMKKDRKEAGVIFTGLKTKEASVSEHSYADEDPVIWERNNRWSRN